MSVLLKIVRAICVLIGFIFLLAVGYPAIRMSPEELMKGRIGLAAVSILFFLLAWLVSLAISKKEKNVNSKKSWLSLFIQKDSAEYFVYEYKTIYFYFLYLTLGLLLIGVIFENISLSITGIFLMSLQFLISFPEQRKLSKIIKQSSEFGPYEISGSKFSFGKPLTIKIKKYQSN